MTLPNMSKILQAIFPDASEVEKIKEKADFEGEGYIVKFDPQKCVMTPTGWDLVTKLGMKVQKIIYNVDSNQVEMHI